MGYLPDGTYVSELEARVQELAAVLGNFKTAYANAHDAQLAAEARVRELEELLEEANYRAQRGHGLARENERLRVRNNDSNYHQKQKAKEISRLRGEVTIRDRRVKELQKQVSDVARNWDAVVREKQDLERVNRDQRTHVQELEAKVELLRERQALAEQKPCTLECDPSCPDHKTCEHAEQEPS